MSTLPSDSLGISIWRRLVMCRFGLCGGTIDHDGVSVYWRCGLCKKVTR